MRKFRSDQKYQRWLPNVYFGGKTQPPFESPEEFHLDLHGSGKILYLIDRLAWG